MAAPESFNLADLEDLEMTEVDTALLSQLLEEFEDDGSDQVKSTAVQSLEGEDGSSSLKEGALISTSLEKESILFQEFGWIDEIDETNPAIMNGDAVAGWYPEEVAGLLEFDFTSINTTEEMAYTCLWDDS